MLVRKIRRAGRDAFFRFLDKLSRHEDARRLLARLLHSLVQERPRITEDDLLPGARPYADLGEAGPPGGACARSDIIFITGRFRSGTTFLWNVFRSIPGVTAYYEPLNERRWFDPATRGGRVDATHKNVAEYWREYQGLEELGAYFRQDWAERDFYMDRHFPDRGLRTYIERMVELAPGRPVLQFNRVDFRLPWLKAQFPHAAIVHIFRHPRDQWCSTLQGSDCPREDMPLAAFEPLDKFYLCRWTRDLHHHFPFLDEAEIAHPYQAFYLIWRLSHIFGTRHADESICFEELVDRPVPIIERLFGSLGITGHDPEKIREIHARPDLGKWKAYADEEWFRRHEARCESVLLAHFGSPLAAGKGSPTVGSRT
jgi:hypothetical protein